MARRLRNAQNDEERVEEVNAEVRAATIRDACRWIADQEATIKVLREEITEYKAKHIRGDLGFKMADFNAIYRISKLEVEDRDKLLDTLREGFAALGFGEQSSFLGALDEAE